METITTKIYPKSPGIYAIINQKTKRVYVGSTKNLYRRLIHHRHQLNTNTHGNPHLQNSFNKYGIENFRIKILEETKDEEKLFQLEEKWAQKADYTYNIRTIEKTKFGWTRKVSYETRRKLSKIKKGKTPANFEKMQQKRWKKVAKIVNDEIVEIFNSCAEAARSLNMQPKTFHQYIGRQLKQKSKYFNKDTRFEYI